MARATTDEDDEAHARDYHRVVKRDAPEVLKSLNDATRLNELPPVPKRRMLELDYAHNMSAVSHDGDPDLHEQIYENEECVHMTQPHKKNDIIEARLTPQERDKSNQAKDERGSRCRMTNHKPASSVR